MIAEVLNASTRRKMLLHGKKRRAKLFKDWQTANPTLVDSVADDIMAYHVQYEYVAEAARDAKPRLEAPAPATNKGKSHKVAVDAAEPTPGSPKKYAALSCQVNIIINSAQLVVVRAGGGTTTFMHLLARHMLPTKGFIAYPDRWRVRYADTTPRIFNTTVMENLKFGNNYDHSEDEINGLLGYIGADSLIDQGDREVGFNGCKLSLTERVMVSVARILLSSPDLVLICSGIETLLPDQQLKIMKVFHDLIEHRGLPCLSSEMSNTPTHLKKRKTVIVSTKTQRIMDLADVVIPPFGSIASASAEDAREDPPPAPGADSYCSP